ncbi:MAG: hypothetical protein R8K50_05235 [Mariprofundus sp.]
MPLSVILVLFSFIVIAVAWVVQKHRRLHASLMASVMVFDLLFPVWLYMTHDWVKRLIDHGEILSFLIWTHLFLILTLYSLYVLQVQAGLQMLAGEGAMRPNHKVQSRGIVIIRAFVFLTGALLIAPD